MDQQELQVPKLCIKDLLRGCSLAHFLGQPLFLGKLIPIILVIPAVLG
jgi:hypothetical protein